MYLAETAEGIAIAKAEGKYKCRKPIAIPDNWDEVIALWKAGDITARIAQKKLEMTPATFLQGSKIAFLKVWFMLHCSQVGHQAEQGRVPAISRRIPSAFFVKGAFVCL